MRKALVVSVAVVMTAALSITAYAASGGGSSGGASASVAQYVAPSQGVFGQQQLPGTVRISGKTGCVNRPFEVRVGGRGITRVVFKLDGRRFRTVMKADRRGKFAVTVNPARQRAGTHRLTATVFFEAARATRARTRTLLFRRCVRRQQPAFTG